MAITRDNIESVIRLIYEGSTISKALKGLNLDVRDFYRALESDFLSAQNFACAQLAAATMRAEEILEIVDTDIDPQRARNRMQARQWLASKMDPKKYGDRIDLNIENRIDLRSALDEARARIPALPDRDLPFRAEFQVLDIVEVIKSHTTGSEPHVDTISNIEDLRRRANALLD